MSENEVSGLEPTAEAPTKGRRPSSRAKRPAARVQPPPWVALAALATALVALALAVVGWFYPSSKAGTGHNKQEAKAALCEVTGTVRKAVSAGTSQGNPIAGDPVGGIAVAGNARLALYAGGSYLLERVDAEPAAPKDLRDAVTSYADTLQQLGINYLAGEPADGPVQQPLRDKLNTHREELNTLCQ